MANHDSAKKAFRQTLKRTLINKSRLSRVKTFIKKVEAMINSSDKEGANQALAVAHSEMMKGCNHGVFKLNAVSRKISRLSAKIKKIA